MLHCHQITKNFGPLAVLKGIDLTITRGEIAAIVGPSGAGKTTLLQLMGTLDRPDRGEIYYEGRPTTTMTEKQLAAFRNQQIGFIFQSHRLLPEFTALENIMLPALIGHISYRSAALAAADLLRQIGLTDRATHKPAALSGGEQQRVAVARALINHPSVVLADEPSGSLDSHNRDELHRLLFDLRRRTGQTFVIVTHDESLAQLADRIIHLVDGQIANPHPPA
jgi:lipoprotein-releasing system ATP-binding protein